jgi:hypothetical protein
MASATCACQGVLWAGVVVGSRRGDCGHCSGGYSALGALFGRRPVVGRRSGKLWTIIYAYHVISKSNTLCLYSFRLLQIVDNSDV